MRRENSSFLQKKISGIMMCAVLFLCCMCYASAQHTEISRGRAVWLGGDKMELFAFKGAEMGLKVMDEGGATKLNYGGHEKAFMSRLCVAGVNGGFFTKENNPLGLVIQNGKRLHTLETGSFAVAGVLFDNGKKVELLRSLDYLALSKEKREQVKEALQGGPFLVEKGKVVKGLDHEKKAARTFIATNGKGIWLLGVSSSLSLAELAQWLANPADMGGFTITQALNFDGGSSSLFWLKDKGSLMYPSKPVRNYLGISPRKVSKKK